LNSERRDEVLEFVDVKSEVIPLRFGHTLPAHGHRLGQAAQGWLELGDSRSANDELEKIDAKFRVHPDVLELRWHLYAKAGNWSACVDIGKALTQLAPGTAVSWIHHAYALHELKRTQDAFDVLSPVAQRFPTEPTIPYNLACYTCQLGRLDEARQWFHRALTLGDAKAIKLEALDDPDLAPILGPCN
jgi:predicted Zn-dependent protease